MWSAYLVRIFSFFFLKESNVTCNISNEISYSLLLNFFYFESLLIYLYLTQSKANYCIDLGVILHGIGNDNDLKRHVCTLKFVQWLFLLISNILFLV